MHILKEQSDNDALGGFISWCGIHVSGVTRSYLSVDNALKAIRFKKGTYPCEKCLTEIITLIKQNLPEDNKE